MSSTPLAETLDLAGGRSRLAAAGSGRLGGLIRLFRRSNWLIRLCFALALGVFGAALSTPWLAPHPPNAQKLLSRLRPPLPLERSLGAHPLGTDELGRDLLSRVLYGTRLTLGIALAGSLVSLVLGGGLGLLGGYVGGWLDDLIMGLVDIQIAVPFTLIALLAIAVFGNDLTILIGIIGLNGWERYARVIRGALLPVRESPFVEAARSAGAGWFRIVVLHCLPNIISPIIVLWTLTFSEVILLESSLSFLGLGVQPPTATLGSMVGLGRNYLVSSPWIAVVPAAAIMFVSLIMLLLGDWLRDALDVRVGQRGL